MLIYIKAPVAAIIGYADISTVEQLTKAQAMRIAGKSGLSADELEDYIASRDMTGAFHLCKTVIFENSISLQRLQQQYDFFPPQSFSYIDLDAFDDLKHSARQET